MIRFTGLGMLNGVSITFSMSIQGLRATENCYLTTSGEGAIDPALFGGEAAIATENDNSSSGGAYAYLNYIFYDKNFEDVAQGGFDRTTTSGANAFDRLTLDFIPEKEGYLFVYVSNEEPVARDVYFDDLKIVHKQSIIAQTDSYYPFGLSHGNMSYVREGRGKNQFLYNGKELVEGFELRWYDYGARYYAPDLGRWHAADPLAEKYASYSPYNYVLNNPIILIDPDGMEPNKGQAGTWEDIKKRINSFFEANPTKKNLESLRYTAKAKGGGNQVGPFGGSEGVRYVYTKKMGWIDMGHFMQVAANLKKEIGTGWKKSAAKADFVLNDTDDGDFGYGGKKLWEATREVEDNQTGETKWSYEDGPSNYAGYDFYLNYYRSDETLIEDLEEYFSDMEAVDPSEAPNFKTMQKTPQKERFFLPNHSLHPDLNPQLSEYGKHHQYDNEHENQKKKDTKNSN